MRLSTGFQGSCGFGIPSFQTLSHGNLAQCSSTIPLRATSHIRRYSRHSDTVDLDYTAFIPPDGNETHGALVILHGLFGSKRNFGSLCKAFLKDLGRPIYALDLRNHGSSPHTSPMSYEYMAADVRQFFDKKSLKDASLLGHSMGGKVAMTVALSPSPPSLSNLIISDIAPTRGSLSESFIQYLEAMTKIEDPINNVKTRDQAGKILAKVEEDVGVRQFLLTNLVLPSASDPLRSTVKFQVPIPLLREAMSALGSFPYTPEDGVRWEGKTLVVKGTKSKYINRNNIPALQTFFPNMKLETMDTGHWVHAEKPNEFKKLLVDFVQEQ